MNPRRITHVAIRALLVLLVAVTPLALADGPPSREPVSPAAHRLGRGSASEYWDLTIELKQGYAVMARFLVTNQGPGSQSGLAVGHIVSPRGDVTKFRNGRLQDRWTLSQDGLRLDIGKSHLDMHAPRYQLRVRKSHALIELGFAPNVLYRLPKELLANRYRIDLLALGSAVRGTIQLAGMTSAIAVEGWATLTHTISNGSETDLNLRRIELFSQRGEYPLYVADFLDPAGKRSRWLAYLEPGCEADSTSQQPAQGEPNRAASVQIFAGSSDLVCLRRLNERTAFDLTLGGAIQPLPRRDVNKPYWIPRIINLKNFEGLGLEGDQGNDGGGRILLKERFLQYEPLGDLPGPIRFFAGLSTKPRRVWSAAIFEVTIPPSLNSTPIQIQGQGVATVSFSNPVTRP